MKPSFLPNAQWFSRRNDKEIINSWPAFLASQTECLSSKRNQAQSNKTFVGQWPCEISFKSSVGSLVCVCTIFKASGNRRR